MEIISSLQVQHKALKEMGQEKESELSSVKKPM
jgi:hypothetical protein